ncbi:hypothetical protein [Sphingomonas gellani]|nr:hypothetical protein [Sphingomonas gellani]
MRRRTAQAGGLAVAAGSALAIARPFPDGRPPLVSHLTSRRA